MVRRQGEGGAVSHMVKKRCHEGGEEKVTLNVTLVKRVKMGCRGGGGVEH
jgi:hypothetical protein